MHSSKKDYRKLYRQQDKFLEWWATLNLPFYLTGGTALGRYYLDHRYSEDLVFFVNADPQYGNYIAKINSEITSAFEIDTSNSLYTDDFTRIFVHSGDGFVKIEFVNEVSYRASEPIPVSFGVLDTPRNILSNKLTAVIGRDEPKDIFDILHIALNYSFVWPDIFYEAKQKAVLNEIDLEERFVTFPVEMIQQVDWLKSAPDLGFISNALKSIADDFLFGRSNSLGAGKICIKNAKPLF